MPVKLFRASKDLLGVPWGVPWRVPLVHPSELRVVWRVACALNETFKNGAGQVLVFHDL